MKKLFRQYFFIFLLLLAAGLMGYNYVYRPFEVSPEDLAKQSEKAVPKQDYSGVKKTAEDTLNELSAEEKVSQMIAQPINIEPEFTTDETEITEETGIENESIQEVDNSNQEIDDTNQELTTPSQEILVTGFYTVFGKGVSFESTKKTTSDLKNSAVILDLVPLFAVDHEGGRVQRLSGDGFTKLDSWRTICGLDTDKRTELLSQSASELKKAGINIVLGPVLDVGNNTILKDRICSTDSYAIVADRSMDYVSTFANQGILSVLKHFPGIGLTTKDLHTSYDYVDVPENDVKLYKYIIDQTEKIGVMTSHVGVVSQDREIPCSVSPYCVSELYKAYPNVLIFTDALEMEAAAYDKDNPRVKKDLLQVSKEAILAGNDVLLFGQSVTQEQLESLISELVIQYRVNPQMKTFVDKSVLKIIKYKYEIQ